MKPITRQPSGRRHIRIVLFAAVAAAALLAAFATAALAGPDRAVRQSAPVTWHAQTGAGGEVVGDASASLVRNRNGISFAFHTAELTPGNAYTLWLVVVDEPQNCANHPAPCTGGDVLTDPAVDGQVVYAAGAVAGGNGTITLAGRQSLGDIDGWNGMRAFDDPFGSEVHLVVNDHGPKIPAMMPSMIHSYRGGCADDSPFPGIFPQVALDDGPVGPNTCLLTQVAIFQS